MIYTVTMNPALDYVLRLDALAPGQTNRAARTDIQYGGKGINVSNVLKNLGVPSVALGFRAGFTGEELARGLEQMGLKSDLIPLPAGRTRINVKLKAGPAETEINAPGPEIPADALSALLEKLDRLGPGDYLVLAGSLPAALPQDTYGKIVARLAGRGVECVVDATGERLLSALPYRPFLIKPNRKELEELCGREAGSEELLETFARELQGRGARNVLVSLSGDGSMLLDETGAVHRLYAPKGQVVNSVGAGDSMTAGFLTGWLARRDYHHAHRLGAAAGAATAFSLGLASRADTERILAQIEAMERSHL